MCKVLRIARSTYYYEAAVRPDESRLSEAIKTAFLRNRRVYGRRKIKVELNKIGVFASRRRISRIMRENDLHSAYSISKYKVHKSEPNEALIPNVLNREFNDRPEFDAVVSDLTYVRVNYKWNYTCLLVDLFNREIIGYSAGPRKDPHLVMDAFATVHVDLGRIQMFHTDRGGEFNNGIIDEVLDMFHIRRSLSLKGCPYDNAVAEATFKLFKTEFVQGRNFESLDRLKLELADYVNWYNNVRIHSSLGYLSLKEFKAQNL